MQFPYLLYFGIIIQTCGAFWFFKSYNKHNPICNKGTKFQCFCSECGSVRHANGSSGIWLSVEFDSCARLKEHIEWVLRAKVAEWINEECAIVLHCATLAAMNLFLEKDNILIGGFRCSKTLNQSVLHLAAIYNTSASLENVNFMDAAILSEIIRAREHLLAAILAANVYGIFTDYEQDKLLVNEGIDKQWQNKIPLWYLAIYAISALLSSFVVSIALVCCVVFTILNWRIQWKRIVCGTWIEVKPFSGRRHIIKSDKIISSQQAQPVLETIEMNPIEHSAH